MLVEDFLVQTIIIKANLSWVKCFKSFPSITDKNVGNYNRVIGEDRSVISLVACR